MQNNKQISSATLRAIAARLQAIADQSRLSLLNQLLAGEKTVTELVDTSRMSQANVSKHLRVLREARLVSFRKHGLQSFYYISDPVVSKLCELLCNSLRRDLSHNHPPRHSSNSKPKPPSKTNPQPPARRKKTRNLLS